MAQKGNVDSRLTLYSCFIKIKGLALCRAGSFELLSHLTLNLSGLHSPNSEFLVVTQNTVYLYISIVKPQPCGPNLDALSALTFCTGLADREANNRKIQSQKWLSSSERNQVCSRLNIANEAISSRFLPEENAPLVN